MGENPIQISQWLDQVFAFGPLVVYLIIFLACFVENIFPPFPGDSFILAAGGLVAVNRLNPALTFLVVIGGGLASVMLLHRLGLKRGREYFMRKQFKYFTVADIEKMELRFRRSGPLILIFSRFVVGLRSALAVAAGISGYRTLPMFVYSGISYVLFGGLLMYIAMILVENLDLVMEYFRAYNLVLWPAVIIFLVWLVARKIMAVRKRNR